MINAHSEPRHEDRRKIILILEDHEPYRHVVVMALRSYLDDKMDILEAAGIQEANSLLQRRKVDLLVADVLLTDGTVSELLKNAQLDDELKVIIFSNHSQETMRAMCHSKQVIDCVRKEEGLVSLAQKVRQALDGES